MGVGSREESVGHGDASFSAIGYGRVVQARLGEDGLVPVQNRLGKVGEVTGVFDVRDVHQRAMRDGGDRRLSSPTQPVCAATAADPEYLDVYGVERVRVERQGVNETQLG